jgi:hypothetical protein
MSKSINGQNSAQNRPIRIASKIEEGFPIFHPIRIPIST